MQLPAKVGATTLVGGSAIATLVFAQSIISSVVADFTLSVVVGVLCFVIGRMSKK